MILDHIEIYMEVKTLGEKDVEAFMMGDNDK